MLYWRAISKEIFTDIKFCWQASQAEPIALKALYLAKHSASLLLSLPLHMLLKNAISASNQIKDIVISNYFKPLIGYHNYNLTLNSKFLAGHCLYKHFFLSILNKNKIKCMLFELIICSFN